MPNKFAEEVVPSFIKITVVYIYSLLLRLLTRSRAAIGLDLFLSVVVKTPTPVYHCKPTELRQRISKARNVLLADCTSSCAVCL